MHELGHYCGATHSPELTSVMRPVLADRQAVAKRFLIVFDPLNALAMNLVAEQIREHMIERLYQVDPRTRDTLVDIYLTLGKAFPDDPAASQYLAMLGESPPATGRRGESRAPNVVDAARTVRDAIVDVADRNRRLPKDRHQRTDARDRRRADGNVRSRRSSRGARYTGSPPTEAFALGLAIAIADTDMLQANSLMRDMLPRLESPRGAAAPARRDRHPHHLRAERSGAAFLVLRGDRSALVITDR